MRKRTEREKEALRRRVLAERVLASEEEMASDGPPDSVEGQIALALADMKGRRLIVAPRRRKPPRM